jgi:hypothetical protein
MMYYEVDEKSQLFELNNDGERKNSGRASHCRTQTTSTNHAIQ